jgi:hypothetical protein
MKQTEAIGEEAIDEEAKQESKSGDVNNAETIVPTSESQRSTVISSQAADTTCGGIVPSGKDGAGDAKSAIFNGVDKSYVYALGRVEARFPSIGIEKEFAQATGRSDTAGLTDRQTLHSVLSQRQNRYLMRQLCWVLTIEGIATYILQPRRGADYDLLVEALRPAPRPTDVDVVIGVRGPIAPPELCNGLMVPIMMVEQMYSFDVDSLIKSIPRPENISGEKFESAAEELFWRIMQMADNAGATDEHRALNYLVVRYPAIYAMAAECYGRDFALTGVEVRPSRLEALRRIVDVIFMYTNRKTDVIEKYFVRVDVTEAFPFLVTKMSPFFDR